RHAGRVSLLGGSGPPDGAAPVQPGGGAGVTRDAGVTGTLVSRLEEERERMLDALRTLVEAESPSGDPTALERCAEVLSELGASFPRPPALPPRPRRCAMPAVGADRRAARRRHRAFRHCPPARLARGEPVPGR